MKIFQSKFVHEKKMNILGFSRLEIDSDSWHEELKTNWYEIPVKQKNKQQNMQITQNYWRVHRSRKTLGWGVGMHTH